MIVQSLAPCGSAGPVTSIVSLRSPENPVIVHVPATGTLPLAKSVIVIVWPTRKPAAFQSKPGRLMALPVTVTLPVCCTGAAGSIVPCTSRRSLPWPSIRLTTSIVLLALSVRNWPLTNAIVP